MVFGGLQKLTLLDYPDKVACTLFTVGCNYRCHFCHNTSLVCPDENTQIIEEREILQFLKTRQGFLDGVCISGGEPLMHSEIDSFIHEVKMLGFLIKIDTNGGYPHRLKSLVASGAIDYVAMDIKNTPEKYANTIGVSGYDTGSIQESVAFLLSDVIPCEFRTTVVQELHSHDDLVSIARWIFGAKKYYLQRFIDSDNVLQSGLHGYSISEMRKLLDDVRKVLPSAELRET